MILLGVLLPILLLVAFLTCILLPLRRVSVGEIRNDVSQNLPLGSTTVDIVKFLEARDIGYSGPFPRGELGKFPGGDDVPESTLMISGIIRDTSYPYRIQTHIMLYFILDDTGGLARFEAEEIEDFL